MTAIELKKLLITKIEEINDISLLNALNTILKAKTHPEIMQLTSEQLDEIQASRREVDQGLFIKQAELDKEFDKWLGEI